MTIRANIKLATGILGLFILINTFLLATVEIHGHDTVLPFHNRKGGFFPLHVRNLEQMAAPRLFLRGQGRREDGRASSSPHTTSIKSSKPLLDCRPHGGPISPKVVADMVYWSEPTLQDRDFVSPYRSNETLFLTVELDSGGFNNVRLVMETSLVFAMVTGRTLVIPPRRGINHLALSPNLTHQRYFTIDDVFDLPKIAGLYPKALKYMPFKQFMKEHFLGGRVRDSEGKPIFPPENRTNWESLSWWSGKYHFDKWLRESGMTSPRWGAEYCLLALPKDCGESNVDRFLQWAQQVRTVPFPSRRLSFLNHPIPVNAEPRDRLEELLATRETLCVYDAYHQSSTYFHLQDEEKYRSRLMAHWYDYLFFEDYRTDLWAKRFVRDNLRYSDSLQCAAARVVERLGDSFHAMHIRRTDFASAFRSYNLTLASDTVFEFAKEIVPQGGTLYIATDEQDSSYFDDFRKRFNVSFLGDVEDLLIDINPLFHGLVEQLVAARAETFIGCYMSTFSAYINRLRGYHSQKKKSPGGWELGVINSWYYAPLDKRKVYRKYHPIDEHLFAEEYPIAWRDIDYNVPRKATRQ
jgi:hypothetical protein